MVRFGNLMNISLIKFCYVYVHLSRENIAEVLVNYWGVLFFLENVMLWKVVFRRVTNV